MHTQLLATAAAIRGTRSTRHHPADVCVKTTARMNRPSAQHYRSDSVRNRSQRPHGSVGKVAANEIKTFAAGLSFQLLEPGDDLVEAPALPCQQFLLAGNLATQCFRFSLAYIKGPGL